MVKDIISNNEQAQAGGKELEILKHYFPQCFTAEGDLFFIIWNLISSYVTMEIKIAEAWSWASENVKRQAFTNDQQEP